jgi:hypothetical protein
MKSAQLPIITSLGIISLCLCACRPASTVSVFCRPVADRLPTPESLNPQNIFTVYGPNISVGRLCSFDGHVTRGQTYKLEIVEGLSFCLIPLTNWTKYDGWQIAMSDEAEGSCETSSDDFVDFTGLVSPPFHGTNQIFIAGFHFRNADNTGANDGSVNAPQEVRWFNFVLDRASYETVRAAEDCSLYSICPNGLISDESFMLITNVPKSHGILTITRLELGNLIPNEKAWIEDMEFEVEIFLPAEP